MGIYRHFPYTNFHDLNLDSILGICRELQDAWAKTSQEWKDTKEFIDNYFNNLDVSQEVLDALRKLADDGTLATILDPKIAETTTDWLNQHVTPTTPIIDSSLTIEGAGADAKSSGIAILGILDKLCAIINNNETFNGNDFTPWISGQTVLSNGNIGSSSTNSACEQFIPVIKGSTVTITCNEYSQVVAQYRNTDPSTIINRTIYASGSHTFTAEESFYIRVSIASLNISDASKLTITITNELVDGVKRSFKAITTEQSFATGIENGSDYNTIQTTGNYKVGSSASAQTMQNCPVKVAHKLVVITTTSDNRLWQIIIPNANADIYIRTNTGSWNEWYRVITNRTGFESYDARITSSNYETLLPDLNDAELNTVYSIAPNLPILNIPIGNYNVAGADQSYGVASGTVITIRGAKVGSLYERFQIFMSAFTKPDGGTGSIINYRGCRYSGGNLVWDEWSRSGDGVNLRATNTFIQESRIQAGTALFDDMNNAPNNTIVQIDLDAVSMKNNPLTGHSCVLVTLCPSYISRHGMLQLCSGIESGLAHLYFRYGWQNSPGDIRWSPWMKCTAVQI